MLTDPVEIEIISKAKQKNVRDPKRSRAHFENILRDFFDGVPLDGVYLDMGPGQYDLGELVRPQGGVVEAIDVDPAVCALGRHKGFTVYEMNLRNLDRVKPERVYDGIWNKFSFNALWVIDDESKHARLVDALASLVRDDGWAWVAPWNGGVKNHVTGPDDAGGSARVERALATQMALFEERGFTTHQLSADQAKQYGVGGNVANNVVFVKNLVWKPA